MMIFIKKEQGYIKKYNTIVSALDIKQGNKATFP